MAQLGSGGLIYNATFSSTAAPIYRTWINGIEKTAYVSVDSIKIHLEPSRATAQFEVIDPLGLYRPERDQEVLILSTASGIKLFAGEIEAIDETYEEGTTNCIRYDVRCSDYGVMLERIVIGHFYELVTFPSEMLIDLSTRYFFPKLGIDFQPTVFGSEIGPQKFNWVSGRACVDQICSAANLAWRVDFEKVGHIFDAGSGQGYTAASISLTDATPENWMALRVSRSRARRANRVAVRNSQDLRCLWTDTFTGTGDQVIFAPLQGQAKSRPAVKVNGIRQIVTDLGEYEAAWDCYAIGYALVFRTPPANGATIEVTYPSPLSHVVWAEDTESIALHGVWEAVEEAKDLTSLDAMQARADQVLARLAGDPTEIQFRTTVEGLQPGQVISGVSITQPPVSGDFVIESVDSQEYGGKVLWSSVKAVQGAWQRIGSGAEYFQRLSTAARQALDRTTFAVSFRLAETVYGPDGAYENPGVVDGIVIYALETAEKDGVLRDVTLDWMTPPTESDIEIDILKNGESIFPEGETLIYRSGTTGVLSEVLFATDPLPVFKGDRFGVEILSGDATAKDGLLKLTIVG